MDATSLSFPELVDAASKGGSLIVPLLIWIIHRATERLARIEKALEKYMTEGK